MSTNYTNKNQSTLICHFGLSPACRQAGGIQNSDKCWIPHQVRDDKRKSFTLIELLVVLALVAILSVVVVMTLNPAELIKQARDSNRLSDLSTINTALNLFSADVTSGFMGTSTVVYVSIPDTSPTCVNLGLPALPTSTTNYIYNCATTQNLRNTDGTGWVPVNFQRISSNSPISQLPVDPINTTTTGKYYIYMTGGSWMLTAIPESQKQKTALGNDPNIPNYPGVIGMGNNISISPLYNSNGLMGYWKFDETSGVVAKDSSGNGNNGTYSASVILGQPGASAQTGKSATFISSAKLSITASGYLPMTLVALHKRDDTTGSGSYRDFFSSTGNYHHLMIYSGSRATCIFYLSSFCSGYVEPNDGLWHQYVVIYSENNTQDLYVDGNFIVRLSSSLDPSVNKIAYIGNWTGTYNLGPMDDVRIYNRALSAAEVLALYNATK